MMIIALEGGVCSGKTTLCCRLQEKGFMHVNEHMTFLSPQDWERFGQIDPVHRIDFLLAVEEKRQALMARFLDMGQNIVLDRTFLSLYAFEYAKGRFEKAEEFKEKRKSFLNPDMILFLSVDEQTRRRRSMQRGDSFTAESDFFLQDSFNNGLKSFFKENQSYFNVRFLDSSHLTSDGICPLVCAPQKVSSFPIGECYDKSRLY